MYIHTVARSGAPKALGVAEPNASSNRFWLRPAAAGARNVAGVGANASRSPGPGTTARDIMGAECSGAGLGGSRDREGGNQVDSNVCIVSGH